MVQASTDRRLITDDMMQTINAAIECVLSQSSFGQVIITIEKGRPRWVSPAPSLPLTPVEVPAQRSP